MSGKDNEKDKDYEVGYRKPPKHSRFKPGMSGNPRGPRPRIPRTEIESQIGKDLREVLRRKVKVNGEEITAQEALLMKLVQSGLAGNAASGRLVLTLAHAAYRENARRKPDILIADQLNFELIFRDPKLRAFWLPYLAELAKLSREP